ncbi:hypothetical protein [Jiangella anatolica]|uniref:Uncharacterized protein n=1 Tax=Jiangella anatolica TaxID=2670374 RepID=A0A2W2B467_9ACTN|nr:hypothetical protein [Jiangella anatolica]PZF79750.1 hypothetical protein C1I92_29655 [Jiangella anatolica]
MSPLGVAAPAPTARRQWLGPAATGALLGLTWASSLRGWMIQLAGDDSRFTWSGTFLCLLLPGAVVGGLLGWAEHLRRTDERRRAHWLVLAPLLFPIGPLSIPGAIPHLFRTGEGSASIGMVLLAMLAGYSLSGRGAVWARIGCGIVGFAIVPAMFLASSTPQNTWAATLFSTLFVTLALACAIPQRRQKPPSRAPGG